MCVRIGHTEFVRCYLTRFGRWPPKYLAGESYAGFRAAALVELLPVRAGIQLSGVIFISPVIEDTLNQGYDYLNVMPWVNVCALIRGDRLR